MSAEHDRAVAIVPHVHMPIEVIDDDQLDRGQRCTPCRTSRRRANGSEFPCPRGFVFSSTVTPTFLPRVQHFIAEHVIAGTSRAHY
jgi:hypothetical protein